MAKINRFPWKGIIISYVLCTIVLFIYFLILYNWGNLSEETKRTYGAAILVLLILYPIVNSAVLFFLYCIGYKHIFRKRYMVGEIGVFILFLYALYFPGVISALFPKSVVLNDYYFLLPHALMFIMLVIYKGLIVYIRKNEKSNLSQNMDSTACGDDGKAVVN